MRGKVVDVKWAIQRDPDDSDYCAVCDNEPGVLDGNMHTLGNAYDTVTGHTVRGRQGEMTIQFDEADSAKQYVVCYFDGSTHSMLARSDAFGVSQAGSSAAAPSRAGGSHFSVSPAQTPTRAEQAGRDEPMYTVVISEGSAGFTCRSDSLVIEKLDAVCPAVDAGVKLGMRVSHFQSKALPRSGFSWEDLKTMVRQTQRPWVFGFASNFQRDGPELTLQPVNSLDANSVMHLSLPELKEQCVQCRLPTDGLKHDLQKRLMAFYDGTHSARSPNSIASSPGSFDTVGSANSRPDSPSDVTTPLVSRSVTFNDQEDTWSDYDKSPSPHPSRRGSWMLVQSFESDVPQLKGFLQPFHPISVQGQNAWFNGSLYMSIVSGAWVVTENIEATNAVPLVRLNTASPGASPPTGEHVWQYYSPKMFSWLSTSIRVTDLGQPVDARAAELAGTKAWSVPRASTRSLQESVDDEEASPTDSYWEKQKKKFQRSPTSPNPVETFDPWGLGGSSSTEGTQASYPGSQVSPAVSVLPNLSLLPPLAPIGHQTLPPEIRTRTWLTVSLCLRCADVGGIAW